MITKQEDVIPAFDKLALPQALRRILEGDVPTELRTICSPPFEFSYPVFFEHPDGFPHADQLLILWDDGGTSLVGYLMTDGVFIEWYFEDGPDSAKVIGSNYQQLAFFVIRQYFNSFSDEVAAEKIANDLEFAHWDGMMQVYAEGAESEGDRLTKLLDQFAASIS